jgi:hypothetical protein
VRSAAARPISALREATISGRVPTTMRANSASATVFWALATRSSGNQLRIVDDEQGLSRRDVLTAVASRPATRAAMSIRVL